jgi:uncharacterized protein
MANESYLLFSVSRLNEGENLFEVDIPPEALDLTTDKYATDVHCKLMLTKIRDRVDVQIDISTSVVVECSRCQESINYKVKSTASLTYLPEDQSDDSFENTTDLEYYIDEIDLTRTVRDCFVLGVPIAPLCRDDCRGLCPSCGANLNREKCSCRQDSKASPFDDLRRFVNG